MIEIEKRVIPTNESTVGLVFECNNYNSLALVKYTKKRGYKIYNPHEILTKEYGQMFLLPTKEKINILQKLAGTANFKIRGDLFSILFDELIPEKNKELLTSDMF